MFRKILFGLMIISMVFISGCIAKEKEPQSKNSPKDEFATILITGINGSAVTGKVTSGSKQLKTYEEVIVHIDNNNLSVSDIGSYITVVFDGTIKESLPPQITATSIEKIKRADKFNNEADLEWE